jgi:hypothetical protein
MHFEELIDRVETSADWRAQKAEQYPDDRPNERSSQALRKLAGNLRALPADDEHAAAFEAAMERRAELAADEPLVNDVDDEPRYISRYGFDNPEDGDPAGFLSGLTADCEQFIAKAKERIAEEEREKAYEAAEEVADEAAREAAHEAAAIAAEEAAKEAAEKAYRKAYDEAHREAYDKAYREALIEVVKDPS